MVRGRSDGWREETVPPSQRGDHRGASPLTIHRHRYQATLTFLICV